MRTLQELMSLEGRSVLITGGAGHIGQAAATALLELGARVALCDNAPDTAQAAAQIGATPVLCDLTDESAARAAVHEAVEALGSLDVVVCAAGLVGLSLREDWNAPFPGQTVELWDATLRINLTSAFVVTQEATPFLQRSGHGSIVLISSIYGRVGPDHALYAETRLANPVAYGVSKGGMRQLVRYLATELAPRVRANSIAPGGIERGQPEPFRSRYSARTPLGRMGTEEDLKGAVAYLASDLSAYVTGHELMVDGGWTAW